MQKSWQWNNFGSSFYFAVILLLAFSWEGPNWTEASDASPGKKLKATATHGIKHCELIPQACSIVCGFVSPSCELSGHCTCRKGPHPKGVPCAPPTELEETRCHPKLCIASTVITRPMVCHYKKKKYCACFPEKGQEGF